ncbi:MULTISPECIES: GntR family transcriptional regulator [Amylolactobacillus]|uniref:GntR family transcriptional regulator n=1 Tax=Amylolactobacillus amylophilus DSM 20533 = JCM 1125 TaxID=1423721 RepID=A0A1L6XC94_9LACO|nr:MULTISPECIES: GntR family transcriptional regulator [Amylolactobacillus]APT18615.1 GntR family transcriptional regulator [Amylolactobacillus amylophilus DSM 20533 = JCM 1125]GED80980.1 GntR family transcriptional regulator [Amylolactobacillus amylophilus]
MADLVYRQLLQQLKKNIKAGQYQNLKLPTERALSESYGVSRSSVKRALNILADEGAIFKKRGSGTFINPLYLKNDSIFHYNTGRNLGVTDSFQISGKVPRIKLLSFNVVHPDPELARNLFLNADDFVYEIKRLRLFDDVAFMIETGYIPIKLAPNIGPNVVSNSIFNYMETTENKLVSKAYLTIAAEPSTTEDRELLALAPTEPVGTMAGIFFLDDGTPFEYSKMRLHYKYMKYNTFVATEE